MYTDPTVRENFFSSLREEVLQIPDLPLISSGNINSRVHANEKEAMFERLLSSSIKKDAGKFGEEKVFDEKMLEETLRNIDNFDAKLKKSLNKYGMSSDQNVKLPKKKVIPEVLYKTIMNTKVEDRSLKFRGFVAVFDIKAKDFPIYDVKILQTVCSTYGFHIVSHKVLPFKKIKGMLYQKDCLLKSDKVKRPDYEELFTNLEGLDFDDLMFGLKLVPRKTMNIKYKTSSMSVAQTAASTRVEFMRSSPGKTQGNKFMEQRLDSSALIVCLAPTSGTNYHQRFGRMLEEKADLFAESLTSFYTSDDRKESFIDVQMFFPELFQVNFMTLINIPSKTRQDKNETDNKLEEMLNLNNFKVVKRFDALMTKDTLVESFKDVFSNHINLAEFLMAESRMRLQITAKLGNMHLNDFGLSTENYIKILDQETNYNLYKHFFPDTYKFSRVVLTIRPFLLKTGLDELFLNIFRLNGFVIVKRVRVVLTEQQALYLAKHEKIEPEYEAHYISLMTDGECEIVLMSNYAAVEKAAVIIDGNNNEWTTTEQLFNVNLDEDNPNPFGSDANLLFKSVKDAISLGKAYDFSGLSVQAKVADERIQLQEKAKLMKAFLSSSFNFAGFCSKNQETTEELISLFVPDCAKISNIYVILKPAFSVFEPEVSALFERLGYKISEKKQQKLTPEEMRSLLEALEKNGDGSEINFEVEEQWDGEFTIFNLFKPAGRKEMLSVLRNFFLHANVATKKTTTITKDNLYCYLVPCWSAASQDFIHQNIYQTVRVFDPQTYIHAMAEEKREIVNYILKTTVGDQLKEIETPPGTIATSTPTENFKDLEQFDTQHITLKAISNHHGDYQIRIRDFRNLPELFIKGIKEEYECINLYYAYVNRMYGQKCPSFYQYRVVPDDDEGIPNHIYDCQEYMGEFFLKVIAEEMFDHKVLKVDKSKRYNSDLFKSKHGSVAAYMYGAKMAVYIKKLEKVKPPQELNGYGQIRILNGKPRGVWQFEDRRALEYQKYTEILSRLSHFIPDVKFDQIDALDDLIKKIFKSEAYRYSRETERLRVVPEFLNPQSLRIFKKPDNRDLKEVHEDYKTLNYDFEQNTYGKDKAKIFNKDFALIYATPQVSGKYKLIANMLYLVEYEFSLLQKVPELAHGSMEEYDGLLKGISLGLRAHHKVDETDQNILEDHRTKDYNPVDFIQMELCLIMLEAIEDKLERFIQMSDFLNEEAGSLQKLMQTRVENRKPVGSVQALSTEEDDFETTRRGKNDNIEKFHKLQDMLVDHIKQLISCVTKLDIAPSLEEKQVLMGHKVKITRDRYFKPLFVYDTENDVFKEKYKKNMTMYGRETLVSQYRDAEFYKDLDENQRRWLYAPDLVVYDIKKPPVNKRGDLYVDPIVIPGEELEKEIIRNEISRSTHFKNIKK